jgi:hypothetical protein
MAEIKLNVLMGQCLNRRIDNMETMKEEANAWQLHGIIRRPSSIGSLLINKQE